jgi:DNA-binding SARP family transcriptional activator
VSAALVAARRRHNSRYRPGSGDRTELPVAPVVYQLRLAHLRDEASGTGEDTELDLDDWDDGDHPDAPGSAEDGTSERRHQVPPRAPRPSALVVGAPETGSGQRRTLAPRLGVRDGREIALDLATARGLGLVGAGAPAAARALLIAALTASPALPAATAQPAATSVLAPADDLAGLLGPTAAHTPLPAALRVVRDLDDALDALEAETLVRAAAGRQQSRADDPWPALVLVARSPEHGWQRLQAVLDNGAPFGITGLLLGQWQPGLTCYVRAEGTISATSPGLGEGLRGTQVFRLGDNDTAELLTLLHHAAPTPPGDAHADPHTGTEMPPPPTPRPRNVAAEPTTDTNNGDNGDLAIATELEVTASVRAPDPTDTELEILGPSRTTAPRARLRPPAAPRQQSQTRLRAEDTDAATEIHHAVPADVSVDGNHEVSTEDGREDGGEIGDEPAPTGEHGTTAAATSPGATPVGQDDTTASPTTDTVPAPTSASMSVPITIAVLGPLRVHWNPEPRTNRTATRTSAETSVNMDRLGEEITGVLQPRTRELLVLLALHPDGITREALVSTLWGADPPARPTNALHTALSRLRHTLAAATDHAVPEIAVVGNGRYQLDPTTVTVDYWRFANAVVARRAATTDQERIDAYRDVVNSYGGPLAEGMTCEWIEPAREAIRRDAIDAVAALARALVDTDPQQTLDLLEVARAFDPHNELLYRDIMRLQERLGQHDAIPRTLTLLTTRLAEVDETPTPQARGLAARLGQRRDNRPDGTTGGTPAPAARSASGGDRGRSAAS